MFGVLGVEEALAVGAETGVTTRPGSCFGFAFAVSASSAGFVPLVKAMLRLSGDQAARPRRRPGA